MKKPKLRDVALFACTLLIITAMLVVNSCKKDIRNAVTNTPKLATGDTSLVGQAKLWYQNNYPDVKTATTKATQSTGTQNTDWSKTFSPYWAQAQTFVQDSLTIIEMPALKKGNMALTTAQTGTGSFDFATSPSVTSILIVIYKGYINAYAMTIMGDPTYLQGNYSKLTNNTYRKKDKNFTGLVLYNAMNGTFINGWKYVNGSVTSPLTLLPATTGTLTTNAISKKQIDVSEPCTVETIEYWEDCSYYEDDIDDSNPFDCYVYTMQGNYTSDCGTGTSSSGGGITPPPPLKCTPPTVSESSIKGRLIIDVTAPPTGGGGTTSTPQACPTTTTTTPIPSSVNTITDSVTNPCLKTIIDNLTNNSTIQTDVTNILRNTFGVSDQVNLTFLEATLPSTEDANTSGDQKDNFQITFNTPQIANASKEFLLETTMHEIFHAYLDENPNINAGFGQHVYMIQNYVNTEVQTLQAVFPNLSTHDAECLVLGGFGVLQQNNPSVFNTALATYNLSASDVQNTNDSYQSGNSGTHC